MTKLAVIPPPQADPELLAFAENLVADIKSGEITGFVGVRQTKTGSAQYITVGVKERFTMLGFLSHLMHKLQSD